MICGDNKTFKKYNQLAGVSVVVRVYIFIQSYSRRLLVLGIKSCFSLISLKIPTFFIALVTSAVPMGSVKKCQCFGTAISILI